MYDLEDNPLANGSVSVESGATVELSVKIDCRTNYALRLKNTSTLIVEGKHLGAPTWTNLGTSEIDLSDWNGSRETFNIRISGADVETRTLRILILEVTND